MRQIFHDIATNEYQDQVKSIMKELFKKGTYFALKSHIFFKMLLSNNDFIFGNYLQASIEEMSSRDICPQTQISLKSNAPGERCAIRFLSGANKSLMYYANIFSVVVFIASYSIKMHEIEF